VAGFGEEPTRRRMGCGGAYPRDGGRKEWVQWCLAPAGLVNLHMRRSGVGDGGRKECGGRLAWVNSGEAEL
jgi:hypothetical protein